VRRLTAPAADERRGHCWQVWSNCLRRSRLSGEALGRTDLMSRRRHSWLVLASVLLMSGCFAWFDFGVEWQDGNYALTWVDSYNSMALSYSTGPDRWGTVIESQVFAVGSDERYIVARQHPQGSRSVTMYFIVDKAQPPNSRDLTKTVVGPLSEQAFATKQAELKLPAFSKTIEVLR